MTNFVDDMAQCHEEHEKEIKSLKEHTKMFLEEMRRKGEPLGAFGHTFAKIIYES